MAGVSTHFEGWRPEFQGEFIRVFFIFHAIMPVWHNGGGRVHPTPFKWFVTVCILRGEEVIGGGIHV